jgi:hypothetical protein
LVDPRLTTVLRVRTELITGWQYGDGAGLSGGYLDRRGDN